MRSTWKLIVVLFLGTSSAYAQRVDSTSGVHGGSTREAARAHFERGVELIGQSRWQDAMAELQAARELRPTPAVWFNLGLAQRAVGKVREAIRSFQQFLATAGTTGNPDLRVRADEYLRELNNMLSSLELHVVPAAATVRVDGEAIPSGVRTIPMDPGQHLVVAEMPGYTPEARSIDLGRAVNTVVLLRLAPIAVPAQPVPTSAQIHVQSNVSDATIRIDGRIVGHGFADETVRPGRHMVDVRAPHRVTFRRVYDAPAGTRNNVHAVLQEEPGITASPWFWTGTAAIVAGAVVAGVVLSSGTEEPYRGQWGVVSDVLTYSGRR